MITLVVGLPGQSANSGAAPLNQQNSAVSSQSFENQLSEAISEALSKFGIDPSSVQLTVQDSASGNSGSSQNSVTPSPQVNTPTTSPPVPQAQVAAASTPAAAPQSVDDAYWAKQPAAVQQLRNIQDPGERALLGTQLASEGYSIDVPIMVWGWDAGVTTQLRHSYGYTWVPSALQQNIPEAPGINTPGLARYDPAHPPAGSITV